MTQLTPTLWLPKYAAAQHFLRIMAGISYSNYRSLWNEMSSQTGSRKSTVSWNNPEEWIPKRLSGYSRSLALRLWRESEKSINPRWSYEILRFVQSRHLAAIRNDIFVLLPKGERFNKGEESIVIEIDESEGVLYLLSEIADRGPGARRDFIRDFTSYFRHATTWSDSSIASSISARLNNLIDRDLIEKTGSAYQISDEGLEFIQRISGSDDTFAPTVELVVNQKNAYARQQLREFLQNMNPYQFEHLIKLLLEEMGYDGVEVTSSSNDKGVDVVANIELGISRVREVIQVKRHRGNIGRPVLDGLRGALFYFNAVRGTIITSGGFTKGTEDAAFLPGAPPITLIDGERLVDLLIEHNIGIRRREFRMLQFDPDSLSEFESEADSVIDSS